MCIGAAFVCEILFRLVRHKRYVNYNRNRFGRFVACGCYCRSYDWRFYSYFTRRGYYFLSHSYNPREESDSLVFWNHIIKNPHNCADFLRPLTFQNIFVVSK